MSIFLSVSASKTEKSWVKKLTIFSRIMIGYFTLLLLVTAVSVYAIYALHKFNAGTRHIIKVDNLILDYEKRLADSILSQIRYEKKYIITRDATFYTQFLSAKEDFSRYLSEVLSIADTPLKKGSLERIKKDYAHYQTLIDQEVAYVRMDRKYPNKWYEQEMGKTTNRILTELEMLVTYSREDIQDKVKVLKEFGASARSFAFLVSGVAIIVVIAISFFFTRSITRPLKLLTDKTGEISSGVFRDDLNISSPPEISELAKAFNLMCDRLKEVDKMKSDFFSSMSHELRTPLTSIKEGISLLQGGVGGTITEKQKRLLSILSEESKRLIDLVNSLLDLSKMEAGMTTYTFEPASLAPLIEKATTEMIPLLDAKKITLKTKIDEKLPSIKMDRERILQVLRNLIGNAVKFTPERGQVRVSARLMNREMEVSVSDTGPGITKENLTAIFEKFHQAHLKNSDHIKGTGLGLAIVKHVITAHGGRVWAESEPGQGSTFVFVLPV